MAEPVTTEEMDVKAKPAMSFARMRDKMASDFIQAASEALANRKAGEWRPMSGAPRSATAIIPVLICAGGVVGEAEWHGELDSDSSDDGWWWANSHGEHWADRIIPEPTHFMPLPEPPKGNEA